MSIKEIFWFLKIKKEKYLKEFLIAIFSFVISWFVLSWKIIRSLFFYLTEKCDLTFDEKLSSFSIKILFFIIWFGLFLFVKLLVVDELFINRLIGYYKRAHKKEKYIFNSEDSLNHWIRQGQIDHSRKYSSLLVTHSNSGCLLKKPLWKNFCMTFDLSFEGVDASFRRLAIIFRAKDLKNYFMIQIWKTDEDKKGKREKNEIRIIPSIRWYGNFEVLEDSGKLFKRERDVLKTKIEVINGIARAYFVKSKTNQYEEVYKWILPTHLELNFIQHPKSNGKEKNEETKPPTSDSDAVPEITFRDKYGKIGFRAADGEKAIINSLEIEAL